MYIGWKLLGNGMYKKTYYAHMLTWVGISKFGAKWHGTFEATALVW